MKTDNSSLALVTGASGLVGAELVHQLIRAGRRVRAIYHTHPISFSSPLAESVSCDLLDVVGVEEIMQGVSEVYHCAGLISYVPEQKQRLYQVNVEATANVVNACLDAGVKKMVHISSIAALGRMQDNTMLNEKSEWKDHADQSHYGHSKYMGESEVWRGIAEGLNAVIVNPSIILGPGDWNKGSTAIFRNVWNGFKWYSEGVNGFVDVRDVAMAMIKLMDAAISGERYILNAGNFSYKQVFDHIAEVFQKPKPHRKITPLLAELVWRLEKIKTLFSSNEPLVTCETARVALMQVAYANEKLLHALPDFHYHRLEETVSYTCQQLLQQYVNKSSVSFEKK